MKTPRSVRFDALCETSSSNDPPLSFRLIRRGGFICLGYGLDPYSFNFDDNITAVNIGRYGKPKEEDSCVSDADVIWKLEEVFEML